MAMLKRLLMVLVAVLLIAVPASLAQGAPGGGGGPPEGVGNRPDGVGGGRPDGAGTKKGDIYADLWVSGRYADGTPVVDDNGCVRPIVIGDPNSPPAGLDLLKTVLDLGETRPLYGDYDQTAYLIPLVGDTLTTLVVEDEDELEPCDVDVSTGWAAIETDMGRLNLGRANPNVLKQQLMAVEEFIRVAEPVKIGLDASGRFTQVEAGDVIDTVDSPLENMAAMQSILEEADIGMSDIPEVQLTDLQLAAAQLAAATPKEDTFEFGVDVVQYLGRILSIPDDTDVMDVVTGDTGEQFLNFSGFGPYTRSTMFPGQIYYYPPAQGATCVPILNEVFPSGSDGYVEASVPGGLAAYVQFAEDARQVLVAVHDIGETYLIDVDSIRTDDIKDDYADCARD